MTYDELLAELESLNSVVDREGLDRLRPLLAEVYPEYVDVDYRDSTQDPWGIGRAIQAGTEIPRAPTVDLSWRLRKLKEQHGIEHNPSYPNPVHALRDILEQIQEGKQPGLYDFGQVLRWLDIALTGRTMKNMHDYARIAELMLDETCGEYYLSDGGYSRVWMDLDEGKAWVTDNSTAEVKRRWKALAEDEE
jgi:hypothetical protein